MLSKNTDIIQILTEAELARIALENKLFIVDWQMQAYCKEIIEGIPNIGIHVIFHENNPIASCVISLQENWLSVFVRKDYRYQGYGKTLIQETLKKYNKKFTEVYGMEGIEGSETFYNSCGVAYFANGVFPIKGTEIELYMNDEIAFETIKQRRIDEYWEKKKHSERIYV